VDGISVFNITNAESVVIELIKLDLNNYSADTQGIIVNEASNKVVIIDNITIDGDGVNGYGIELQSNNCRITNCNITDMNYGINIDGDNNKINGNVINTNLIGINLTINSDLNYVKENSLTGNTVQWSDNGTNNDIEYRCFTAQDIQDAIDSIDAKSGTIKIVSSFNISAMININNGGFYIIEGEGDGTVLTTVGNITVFNITNAKTGTTLRNLKIDASSLTTNAKEIININEGSDNQIVIDTITIIGDSVNGYGIEINSNDCIIINCHISTVNIGLMLISDSKIDLISNSTFFSNATAGIYISTGCDNNNITGNVCYSNEKWGIYVGAVNYVIITNNTCYGNNADSADNGGGLYIKGTAFRNIIINNASYNNVNIGVGNAYGLRVESFTAERNKIGMNILSGNDIDFADASAKNIIYADDTAYGVGWNGKKGTPTTNVVYDIVKSIIDRLDAHGI